MDYICCDSCASEFVVKDNTSATLRCPDCHSWIDLYDTSNYATTSYTSSLADAYMDYDMDNYGFQD